MQGTSGTIFPFIIELDNGSIGPAWTLEGAIEVGRDAETAGRTVVRISQGTKVVLEGDALRGQLDN